VSQEVFRRALAWLQVSDDLSLLIDKFLDAVSEPLEVPQLNVFSLPYVDMVKGVPEGPWGLHESEEERWHHVLHVVTQIQFFKFSILFLEQTLLVHIRHSKDTSLDAFVQEDLKELA